MCTCFFINLTQGHFLHCILEREEGREGGREKYPWAWTRDQTRNSGMYPNRERNPPHFSYRMTLQPTEPHRPEMPMVLLMCFWCCVDPKFGNRSKIIFTLKFSLMLEHILNTTFKCFINALQHMLKKKPPNAFNLKPFSSDNITKLA